MSLNNVSFLLLFGRVAGGEMNFISSQCRWCVVSTHDIFLCSNVFPFWVKRFEALASFASSIYVECVKNVFQCDIGRSFRSVHNSTADFQKVKFSLARVFILSFRMECQLFVRLVSSSFDSSSCPQTQRADHFSTISTAGIHARSLPSCILKCSTDIKTWKPIECLWLLCDCIKIHVSQSRSTKLLSKAIECMWFKSRPPEFLHQWLCTLE